MHVPQHVRISTHVQHFTSQNVFLDERAFGALLNT